MRKQVRVRVLLRVPELSQTAAHSSPRYSPPLSERMVQEAVRFCACRKLEQSAWKRLSISGASLFSFMK